ncbi:MAG: carbohydrate kinase [Planctomycetota bacterium]|nr:MAG: carbohydrate kinase [Planctomycetota bacterium]
MSHLLGLDIGSSSVKACLLEIASGRAVASATSPTSELPIEAPQPGFAEQHPHTWWQHVVAATRQALASAGIAGEQVQAIGISYQMHGLVCLDQAGEVLRPAIIWCDSRAVPYGEAALRAIGSERCLSHLRNSPGNFTASKLAWVKEHEPEIYARVHRIMLPGDWIAYRLTGRVSTTASGLSEGILWDMAEDGLAGMVLDHFGFDKAIIPEVLPSFAQQGGLSSAAAAELGLAAGTQVTYRGGDQPNNALSLNVLQPGELAATAGTSGVVYGVTDGAGADPQQRVNTFVHLNHRADAPRYGVLLCVNGTGIASSWMRRHTCSVDGAGLDYPAMNDAAARAPVGSDGLLVLPFGNGAERTLGNRNPGAAVLGLDFNRHGRAHLLRATQEGIVFAMKYGIDVMAEMGVPVKRVRAGYANSFLSPLFREAFATTCGAELELYDTDGAQGAARGAGLGAGIYADAAAAFADLERRAVVSPDAALSEAYATAYSRWRQALQQHLG